LLNGYLRKVTNYNGFVMSDWGATHSTVASAKAGMDMDMNATDDGYYSTGMTTAVQNGQVAMKLLDTMVLRILTTMFRVGLFDHPTPAQPGAAATVTDTQSEKDFAQKLAESGMVLMQNNANLLPLPAGGGHVIALIGRPAGSDGTAQIYNGGGSGHIP